MTRLVFGERPVRVEDVAAASTGDVRVDVTPELRARMQEAREVLDAHLEQGIPVYGLNTGLGGNIGHRIPPDEAAELQAQLVLARVAGVGNPLPLHVCRAALFCRLAGLAGGGAGVSLPVFDLLAEMLARDVIPVIPSHGSTGASDLVQTMSIAAAAIGKGQVYLNGATVPAADALAAAGLAPAQLAPKDGLSIGSASSVTAATAALAIAALDDLLAAHIATAALACQGLGASPHLFDPRVVGARPAAMQVEAAELFRRALDGSDFFSRRPAKVQDAISFRALPQVTGTVLGALAHARREVEIEMNATADNPLVLVEGGEVRPSANFLTASLALAFDTLAIALAQLATASVQRSIKLMTGHLSGLANYLSPVGGASAGFVPMQKSLAALHAEIRLRAMPASLDGIVVSEMVEDIATNSTLAVSKLSEQLEPMRWLVSMEAMFAAQAVDLRREREPDLKLSQATALVYDEVRKAAPMLHADRATGPEAGEVHRRLWAPENLATIRRLIEERD
ncbi:aromatic amino acid lyase [Pseudaminobacter sp. 19-2017]|uniref:Aromatic amino acid lyase n=1 Tax=Pseudaminobacter soli (ex Zhang et al. 2022) TaxID=2831468 RepID=A0A942E514_9HYPH|nr:aromatic amino acid ammonia-lyase [Pseudaminobacter soli]MBS3651278.1 aromatic amino acid lyase [Pseudaminobacter soli]